VAEYIEPLDLREILINYFLGSMELFAFAFIMALSAGCAYFGMPNKVFLLVLAVSSIIVGVFLGEAIYILALLLIGLLVFKGIAKLVT